MATTPVSPKVKAGGVAAVLTGLALTAVLAILNNVTPDMLAFLGAWQGVGVTLLSSVAAVVAGYVAKDALRIDGANAAGGVSPSNVVDASKSEPVSVVPAPLVGGVSVDPTVPGLSTGTIVSDPTVAPTAPEVAK